MCCWYDYWNIAPGPADGPDEDFLDVVPATACRQHDDAVRASARSTSSTCTTTRRATCSTTTTDAGDQRPPAAQHAVAVGSRLRRRVVDRRADRVHPADARRPSSSTYPGHAAVHLGVELRRRRRRSTARWRSPRCSAIYGREGVVRGGLLAQPAGRQPRVVRLQDARQLRRRRLAVRRTGRAGRVDATQIVSARTPRSTSRRVCCG